MIIIGCGETPPYNEYTSKTHFVAAKLISKEGSNLVFIGLKKKIKLTLNDNIDVSLFEVGKIYEIELELE